MQKVRPGRRGRRPLQMFIGLWQICNVQWFKARLRRGRVTTPYKLFVGWPRIIKSPVGNGLDRSGTLQQMAYALASLEGSCPRSGLKGGSLRRA